MLKKNKFHNFLEDPSYMKGTPWSFTVRKPFPEVSPLGFRKQKQGKFAVGERGSHANLNIKLYMLQDFKETQIFYLLLDEVPFFRK